ncbi:MAG: hypothetical protein APG08_01502 [Candidatus Methanofastidiosum methylothiophilum]|jgi:hypothetical protein|uniref:Uncharacterized protein n=1 Tax=Candidatus Methanofastidiosum methylothiophilum TaxID=1705564 RepID=A0A150JF53_9EURY|nr:MAG: hypothetical protein APG08_01502 [Candidatus Methanofastidiosum methylthiophilus]KYC55879.1 MAG: hypothetical protein APG09_01537 [Candidatus Methanofastidiosum methylthiophilus]
MIRRKFSAVNGIFNLSGIGVSILDSLASVSAS